MNPAQQKFAEEVILSTLKRAGGRMEELELHDIVSRVADGGEHALSDLIRQCRIYVLPGAGTFGTDVICINDLKPARCHALNFKINNRGMDMATLESYLGDAIHNQQWSFHQPVPGYWTILYKGCRQMEAQWRLRDIAAYVQQWTVTDAR